MLALIDPWILGFSLITVVVTVIMGFRSARSSKSAADFFVAGRSVSVGWNASAISGEYLSAASFMGVAGMVMSSGYDALWYPVCYACGYLFLLLFIAGPLRRFGAYTIPDFAEGRYDSPVFRKIAVVFVLFIGCFYTMPQMKGAGTTLAYIFKDIEFLGHKGLPYWVGVALVGAIITLNVALGGMKGITLVQAVQYWAKMFAISVPIFVLASVYGGYGKQLEARHSTASKSTTSGTNLLSLEAFHVGPQPRDRESLPDQSLYVVDSMSRLGPGSYARWKNNFTDLLGRERRMTVLLQEKSYSVIDLLLKYQESQVWQFGVNQYSGYIAKEITARPIAYSQTGPLSRDAFADHVKRVLATNGVTLVAINRELYKAVPTESAARYQVAFREPSSAIAALPAKAPADAAWLNPFGPLTTKAAKAAKPKMTYTGKVIWSQVPNKLPSESISSFAVRKFFPSTQSVNGGSSSARTLFEIYVHLSGWANPMDLRPTLPLGVSPSLITPEALTNRIAFKPPTEATPAELAQSLLQALSSSGITTLQDSEGRWIAAPTKEVTITTLDSKPYALLYTYSLIIALVCGTAGLPHILVRFYTNPDGVAAKRTTMWVMILIGVFYVFPPVFGVLGRNLMPALYDGVGVNGTDGIVLKLPTLLGEKYGILGSILSGITCAGAFAAFMSTFSGLLVSMTGALAHDVYGRILRPQSTPAERMRMFKFCAIGVGTVAVLLGTLVENFEINFMVGQAFAIAAASYFPLLFMSVWWRGMTTRGAATGMLTGGLLAVAAISLTSWTTFITTQTSKFKSLGIAEPGWFAAIKPYSLTDYWADHPLLRILCEQPAIWAVPTAIGLMVIVSKLTSASIPKDIRMKMLVLHAPEALGLKQEYIRDHEAGH